jgi:hypothetical protein
MKPTVIIHLIKDAPRKFPGRRPQPFRYLVKDGGNHKFYEKSSENLTNRGDALEAIWDVHGYDATVILREEGKPDRILRRPYSRKIDLTEDEIVQVTKGIGARITGTPFTDTAVLLRLVDIINDVIAPHQGHVHANVFDFTGIVDVADVEAQIKRLEDQ